MKPNVAGPLLFAIALASILGVVRAYSPGIPEGGDDVSHFLYAKYCWRHAEAALSQWGKPVFTLLASPFARFGPEGMTVFALLCAVATGWCIMRWTLTNDRPAWAWAVPALLFTTPIYVSTVLRGFTEPLFGLASAAIVLAILERRHALAMAMVSLLPFVRPEYAAFAPFAVTVVALRRDYRALPWALLGPVAYCATCALFLGAPWLLFTANTYLGGDQYGRGSILHFVDSYDAMFGLPLKRTLLVALAVLAALLWRDEAGRRTHATVACLTLAPAAGIFALHSYAWWHGGLASFGLLRVMTTIVPLMIFFIVHVLGSAWNVWIPAGAKWSRWVFIALLAFYCNTGYHELRHREQLPVAEQPKHRLQAAAAAFVLQQRSRGERVYWRDPSIPMFSGLDPWDLNETVRLDGRSGSVGWDLPRAGDWLVWEPHFAQDEGALPLERLLNDRRYVHARTFAPDRPFTIFGDRPYKLEVFRYHAER